MESQPLTSVLESLLFVSNKPLKVKELSEFLDVDEQSIQQALTELKESRENGGVIIVESNGQYQMATSSHNSPLVKDFLNQDLREKLTDATVEVLAIIAYRQPITKAEIEAIRGVSSQYSIRHLLMRGLIEKVPNPSDARGFLYQTTTEFLQHMGLSSVSDLPSFESLVEQIKLPETPAIKPEATEEAPGSQEPAVEIIITENQAAEPQPDAEPSVVIIETSSSLPSEPSHEKEEYADEEDEDLDDEEDIEDNDTSAAPDRI